MAALHLIWANFVNARELIHSLPLLSSIWRQGFNSLDDDSTKTSIWNDNCDVIAYNWRGNFLKHWHCGFYWSKISRQNNIYDDLSLLSEKTKEDFDVFHFHFDQSIKNGLTKELSGLQSNYSN